MMTRWENWLRDCRASGWGGLRFADCAITRGLPYVLPLTVPFDASTDTFEATLLLEPDFDATPLATFTVEVGAFDDEATVVTLSLTDEQTGDLPLDGDLDGIVDFVLIVTRAPYGEVEARFLAGAIPAVD